MAQRIAAGRKSKADRDPNKIIVLSQTVLSQGLQNLTRQMASLHPEMEFVFKCHPSEDDAQIERDLSGLRNLKVMQNCDLYSLMEEAAYVVGVFSTALYEATALGCKPILVNLPGIEYMRALIDDYGVPVIDDPKKLSEALALARDVTLPVKDFFGVDAAASEPVSGAKHVPLRTS